MSDQSHNSLEPDKGELSASTIGPGSIIENRYRIEALLGKGSQASVFKAEDLLLSRALAIKVFQNFDSDVSAKKFVKEVQILASLDHPNIVHIFSSGILPTGEHFLVMELVSGITLDDFLKEKGCLSPYEFKIVFSQLISALQAMHDSGIIHRDLKPSNILIASEQKNESVEQQNSAANSLSGAPLLVAKIVDFGIAKQVSSDNSQDKTKTQILKGTAAYMSPEQCSSKPVDARSDIYSLACVMYEALKGKPLFEGGSEFELMYKQINEPAPALASGIKSLDSFVMKALEKKSELRYESAAQMLKELPASAIRDPVNKTQGRSLRKPVLLMLALTTLTIGVFFVYATFAPKTTPGDVLPKERPTDFWLGEAIRSFKSGKHYPDAYNDFLKVTLDKSPKQAQHRATAFGHLAGIEVERNNESEAEDFYRKQLQEYNNIDIIPELESGLKYACMGLARVLSQRRKFDEASKVMDRAIDFLKIDTDQSYARVSNYCESCIVKANIEARRGNFVLASKLLGEVQKFDEKYSDEQFFRTTKAIALSSVVQKLILEGKVADAKLELKKLVAYSNQVPKDFYSHCLGDVFLVAREKKQFELMSLVLDAEEAISKYPGTFSNSTIYTIKGHVQYQLHNQAYALKLWNKALEFAANEKKPTEENATNLYILGTYFSLLPDLTQALKAHRLAQKMFKENGIPPKISDTAWYNTLYLAKLEFSIEKNYSAAEADLQELIKETVAAGKEKEIVCSLAKWTLANVLKADGKMDQYQRLKAELAEIKKAYKQKVDATKTNPAPWLLLDP